MRCCNCGKSISSSGAFCAHCYTFHPTGRSTGLTGLVGATFGALVGAAWGGIAGDHAWAFVLGGFAGLVVGSIFGTVAEVIAAARNSTSLYYGEHPSAGYSDAAVPAVKPEGSLFKIAGLQQSTQSEVICQVRAVTETNARAKAELCGILVSRIERVPPAAPAIEVETAADDEEAVVAAAE